MKEEKTEAIVLRCLDYKDKQRIITAFSKDNGLMSLIVKGISYQRLAATTPFYQMELLYFKGRSDLYHFVDASILESHLFLRTQFDHLQTAGALALALLHSQMPGTPSKDLYTLFILYCFSQAL